MTNQQLIHKYEITTLHGKYEEKHIVNAITAHDAITQFQVKTDCDYYKITNIEPYVKKYTGEEIIRMNELHKKYILKHKEEKQQQSKFNRILYGLLRFGH